MLTGRIEEAFALAAQVHHDQIRKGTGVPYLTHLMAVSAIVGEFGGDEDQIIAGLLHDTLEDQPERVSVPLLVERFGWRVGHIVVGCSDCTSKPKPPWEQRKQSFLVQVRAASPDVRLVIAADKLHNASSLVRDVKRMGHGMWTRFNAPKERQCWYLRNCVATMGEGWTHPLLDALDEVVTELESLCDVGT